MDAVVSALPLPSPVRSPLGATLGTPLPLVGTAP